MSPLRLGVIGLAGIGQAHLFAAKTLAQYELAAVCDIAEAPREKVARDFDVPGFDDAGALYAEANLDAVVIATPRRPTATCSWVRSTPDSTSARSPSYR